MGVTVATTRVALNTDTGEQNITTDDLGGLTPKAAMLFLSWAVTDGVAADGLSLMVGITDGVVSKCHNGWDQHNLATSNTGYSNQDVPIYVVDPATGSVDCQAAFSAWITNGVTINITDAPTSALLLTVTFFAGTDVSADVDIIKFPGTDTVDVTAPGFEPDLVFVLGNDHNSWPISSSNMKWGFGVCHNDRASGITQRCVLGFNRDNRADAQTTVYYSNAYVTGAFIYDAIGLSVSLGTFDANGFTATASEETTKVWAYLALRFVSGPAVASWVGDHTTPTETGNDAEIGPSFTPQAVILHGTMAEAVNTVYTDALGGSLMVSAFDEDDAYATSGCADDGAATTDTQSLSDDVPVQLPDDDGSAGLTASFVSLDANGWTLNYTAVKPAAKYMWAVAIEGEAAAEGNPWYYYAQQQ